MIEEYSLITEELESRKTKRLKKTGHEEWVTDIGEPSRLLNVKSDEFLIKESQNNV